MAVRTDGDARFVRLDAAKNQETGTEMEGVRLADIDNITTTPHVIVNARDQAVDGDLALTYTRFIDGRRGQILELQVEPDAAVAAINQAAMVALKLKIWRYTFDAKGKLINKRADTLKIGDRATPAGGAGLTHQNGLADGGALAAGVYGPVARFIPGPNEGFGLRGHQIVDFYDSL